MPEPSENLLSVLVQAQPEQKQRGEESRNHAGNSLRVFTEANDWYYGTEELLDALPRRWTRSMLYLLVTFTVIVLPWSMLAEVDETGSARGRLEPQGATQKLGVVVTSSVKAVNVKPGSTVKAGQVLLELDSDVLRTQLDQAQTRLSEFINRQGQQELLKNQLMLTINIQEQQNQAQQLEKMAQVNQAQQNFDAKQSTYNLQKLETLSLVEQARQNINSSQLARQIAKSRLQRDIKEVMRYQHLFRQGAIAQIKVVELEKIAEESQRSLLQANSDFTQAQLRLQEQSSRYQTTLTQALADIQQAKLRLQEQQSSYRSLIQAGRLALLRSEEQLKDLQNQLTTLGSEINQTKSQILGLQIQIQQRVVRSPIDGTVFELPIEKPGPVVEAGQIVAQIAPENAPLILKAKMPSQNSGFLKVGMPVKIKFDAYPFQDYGILSGRVNWVSPDSTIETTSQGNVQTYEIDIVLDHPYIENGNKRIYLTPGQTANAEVIIRQRRIIDFILDPFKKLQKSGLEL